MVPVAEEDSKRDQNTLNLTEFRDNFAFFLLVCFLDVSSHRRINLEHILGKRYLEQFL